MFSSLVVLLTQRNCNNVKSVLILDYAIVIKRLA